MNLMLIQQIEAFAVKFISAKKQDKTANTSEWEMEIDNLVYSLYELTEEEIKIIKGGG